MKLDCIPIQRDILEYCRAGVEAGKQKMDPPVLSIITVQSDPQSIAFAKSLQQQAKIIGGVTDMYWCNDLQNSAPFLYVVKKMIKFLKHCQTDCSTTGIAVILPQPSKEGLSRFNIERLQYYVQQEMDPKYDVCGVRPAGLARTTNVYLKDYAPILAPAAATVLNYYGISPKGKTVSIVNSSPRLGMPLTNLLHWYDSIPVMLNSRMPEPLVTEAMKNSDIVITGVGVSGIFSERHISWMDKPVIIDFGRGLNPAGEMDSDFDLSMLDHDGALNEIQYANIHTGLSSVVSAMVMLNFINAYEKKYQEEVDSRWSLRASIPEDLKQKFARLRVNYLF